MLLPGALGCFVLERGYAAHESYGIGVIRVAEFAWNLFEPEEGRFDDSFWDRFLNVAKDCGMQVIFCTPTATPPAWLTEKYPEVLKL